MSNSKQNQMLSNLAPLAHGTLNGFMDSLVDFPHLSPLARLESPAHHQTLGVLVLHSYLEHQVLLWDLTPLLYLEDPVNEIGN